MKLTTKILIVCSALWMVFIFVLSSQSKESSSNISDNVTAVIVETMYGDEKPQTFEDIGWKGNEENIAEMLDKGLVPKDDLFGRSKFTFKNDIRKIAHIFLFFVLAVLVNSTFISAFGKNKARYIMISFAICAAYASLDELHQYFVPGRGALLSDVGIDCIGVLMGLALVAGVCAVTKLIKSNVNRTNKTA